MVQLIGRASVVLGLLLLLLANASLATMMTLGLLRLSVIGKTIDSCMGLIGMVYGLRFGYDTPRILVSLLIMGGALAFAIVSCVAPHRRSQRDGLLRQLADDLHSYQRLPSGMDDWRLDSAATQNWILRAVKKLHQEATLYGFLAGMIFGGGLLALLFGGSFPVEGAR